MRWLYSNLGYKVLALVLAVMLWGIAYSSPPIEVGIDVPVVIEGIPDDLVVTSQSASEVNVRISGTRASLRNLSPGDLVYPLALSGAKSGEMTVEVEAANLDLPRGARPVSRSPSRIELTLSPRGTRSVEVKPDIEGEPAAGHRIVGVAVEPPRIRITGARSEVLRLTTVATETIDVSEATGDVEREVRISLLGGNVWVETPARIRVWVRIEAESPSEPAAEPDAGEAA
jgi:YbbR domain-containing protein